MAFNIGELFGTIRIQGAAEATQQVRGVGAQFTRTGEAAGRAAGMVDEASAALAGSGRAAGIASSGTAKYRAAQLSAVAATERYNAVLAQEDASLGRLAAAEAAVIRANERVTASTPVAALRRTSAVTDEAAASTSRLGAATASGARMAAQLGLVFGAFEAVKKVIDITKEAAEFQRSMVQIQTNADVTAQEVGTASKALLAMGGDVAAAPEDLATSLYHVESVGLRSAKALNVVKIAAEGAKVGNADLEETTNALTASVASGIKGVQNMGQAMGALIAIVGSGDMKLSDLDAALGTGVLTVVKGYGLSLKDVGAALATFGDNNIRGAHAATMLRMAVQAMAVPAVAGIDALNKLGLSADKLRQDMAEGGLNKAILDLNDHLQQSNVSANEVGGLLTQIFGKRAGPGLQILIGQLTRLQSKYEILGTSATHFASKWQATTRTASFAFSSLWAKIQAGGIVLTEQLTPAVASAARWLGTSVPHALSVLADALGPTVHLIGAGLVGAWHAAIAVLGPAASALGDVGHFLADNKALTTALAVAVGTMWLAFKGVAIATAAVTAVKSALLSLRAAMMLAQVSGVSSFRGILSAITPTQAAIAGLAIVVGAAAYEWQKHRQYVEAAIAAENADIQSLTGTIQQDSGAVGQNTKAWIENKLTQSGAYDQAAKLGVSFDTVTRAAMGQAGPLKQVNAALNAMSTGDRFKVFRDGAGTILELGDATGKAAGKVRTLNELNAVGVVKMGLLDRGAELVAAKAASTVRPLTNSGDAAKGMGNAMYGAWLSGKKLAAAMQDLGGKVDTAQAFVQMKQGVLGLKDAFDKNTSAVGNNNKAQLQNKSALLDQIQNVQSYAATLDHGKNAAQNVANATISGLAALRSQAMQLGVSKSDWNKLIAQMNLTPRDIRTTLHAETNTALANVRKLRAELADLPRQVAISVSATGSINVKGGHYASGGTIRGAGTSKSDSVPIMASNGEEVIQEPFASRYRPLLKMMNVGRFAGGGTITTKMVGGKKEWVYAGQEYASLAAAQNAQARAAKENRKQRMSDARSALGGVGTAVSGFSWAQFQRQLSKAIAAVQNSGATGKTLAHMEHHLAQIEAQGARAERRLGRTARQQAHRLGHMVGNLANVQSAGDILGQLHNLEGSLRQAGVPRDFVKSLENMTGRIKSAVSERNQAARHLAQANAALHNAEQKLHSDQASFRQATIGGFDITSAGADANGNVSSGSLRAAQAQSLSRVRAWVSGMKKLAGKHIFPASYLRQLAGAGPSSLPTIRALLSMNAGDLREFASNERSIAKLAGQESRVVGKRLDQGAINQARQRVRHDEKLENRREKHLEHVMDHAMDRIGDELKHLHLLADLHFNRGELALAVKNGENDNRKRRGHKS